MVQFEELRLRLLESEKPMGELAAALGLEEMAKEIAALEEQTAAEDFWGDLKNSQKVLQRIASLKNKIKAYEDLKSAFEDALVMIELSDEEGDLDLLEECQNSVEAVEKELDKQILATLLSGEYDNNNAILTFHAGAGGTEAQDWCQMLFRMYGQWATKRGFKFTTVDFLDGDEAGLKSAVVVIEGENAYGYLKSEMGVHRLVRVSPFDSSGRRHTSFASLEVMPEIDDTVEVEIREEDIKMEVASKYGMIQPNSSTTQAVRAVFIIDPNSKIRAVLYYPLSTGRNFSEIKRLIIALQKADSDGVATPADWKEGDDVIVPTAGSCGTAKERMESNDEGMYCLDWFMCFKKEKK